MPAEYWARLWWLYAALWLVFALVVLRSPIMEALRTIRPLEADAEASAT